MRRRLALIILLAGSLAIPHAVLGDSVFDGWNAGTVDGWNPATNIATLDAPISGGVSGGYLQSSEDPFTYGIVGAVTYAPTHTGDFNAHGYVRMQVAVKFIDGAFLSAYLHLRYLDAGHNGWERPLDADFDDPGWQLFYVDIDPTWTDQQAQAAGWIREAASASFVETMAAVYSVGIKATGTGVLTMGIDHFSLQDAASPTTPMAWGGIKRLYR